VAREIRSALPAEDILYVADTAYCPYGDRPIEEVRARALAVGRYIQESGAKLVVAACNTASGAALEDLRATPLDPGRRPGARGEDGGGTDARAARGSDGHLRARCAPSGSRGCSVRTATACR
jgi:glutamate racemase